MLSRDEIKQETKRMFDDTFDGLVLTANEQRAVAFLGTIVMRWTEVAIEGAGLLEQARAMIGGGSDLSRAIDEFLDRADKLDQ